MTDRSTPNGRERVRQRLLSEVQNTSFDTEYHTAEEFAAKVDVLKRHFGRNPVHFLDAGGGNGLFTDALLEKFPTWSSTIVDVSDHLLVQNAPRARKRVVKASIYEAPHIFQGVQFDMISLNWILHHLVGENFENSVTNITQALLVCTSMLKAGGIICVGENNYSGVWGTNISARLIFGITAVRNPVVKSLVAQHANTAGVGVCFQSEVAWVELFLKAGLVECYPRYHHRPFNIRGLKKWALLLKTAGKVHFYLRPS